MLDESLIAFAVRRSDGLVRLQRAGVSADHFVDEFRTVWGYILRSKRQHGAVPSEAVLNNRFPDLQLPDRVRLSDVKILIHDVKQRYKYICLLQGLNRAADGAVSFEQVDDVISSLQGELNRLMYVNNSQGLVDLFSEAGAKRVLRDYDKRRRGGVTGIPTGLRKFDTMLGGLQKQRMVTVIGRSGLGKSWITQLFVKSAVISGAKVALFPLEMTYEEVAYRLYTLFSSSLLGAPRVLRNYDLTMGRISKAKVVRFLNFLQDHYAGQLLVADIGSLSDPYTVERVEAETEMNRPDQIWIDYITLMRHGGRGGLDDWAAIGHLANGVKEIAVRQNVVGGCCAQVNREALKSDIFLPRLEHISNSDGIAHATDQCFTINRKGKYLYYSLCKNRGGPEIGQTRVKFEVNLGLIEETGSEETEED